MNMKKYDNRKIIFVITAMLIILIAVISTTYAMFSASFTGTKEQRLTTGEVSMSCSETSFNLNDTGVLSDEEGIALNNNQATCTLVTTLRGNMTLGYDVALYDVDSVTPNDVIGEGNVKIQASKVKDNQTTYLAGSSATTGILVDSIKNFAGQYDSTITGYKIDSATTAQSEEVLYRIKAWVASESVGTTTTSSTDGKCSDETIKTKSACQEAGGIWGYEQRQDQEGGSFSFKLKVGAAQILS